MTTTTLIAGQTISALTLNSSDILNIGSLATAYATLIDAAGVENVASGGTDSGAILNGGTLVAAAGALLSGTINLDSGASGTFITTSASYPTLSAPSKFANVSAGLSVDVIDQSYSAATTVVTTLPYAIEYDVDAGTGFRYEDIEYNGFAVVNLFGTSGSVYVLNAQFSVTSLGWLAYAASDGAGGTLIHFAAIIGTG